MLDMHYENGRVTFDASIFDHSLVVREGVRKSFHFVGRDLQRHARDQIKNGPPRTGRWYVLNGRRRRASGPGEPPKERTGELRKSTNYQVRQYEMEFGYEAPYGKWLEEGTSKMAPRPNLHPTIQTMHRNAIKHIEREIMLEFRQRMNIL